MVFIYMNVHPYGKLNGDNSFVSLFEGYHGATAQISEVGKGTV